MSKPCRGGISVNKEIILLPPMPAADLRSAAGDERKGKFVGYRDAAPTGLILKKYPSPV
ncbi:MAG: hypothetical protein IPP46_19885 [Bacteroidetes bacterium]|nr:hypothetical protein [Bacteroidota bacterium]